MKRRYKFLRQYHFKDLSKRRYSVYMKGDFWKLVKFIIFSVTLIKPVYDSAKGYLKIRDVAWFLHPIMCLGVCCIYGYAAVASLINK